MTVFHPNQSGSHNYQLCDWKDQNNVCPFAPPAALGVDISITLDEGIDYVFNGKTDGVGWWCTDANTKTVLIAARWNDAPIWLDTVTNGNAGCNLKVHTTAPACPANDQDCDGYTAANGDCSDTNALLHPNQLETWGDAYDADCNAINDPPSWRYAVVGVPMGANAVQLVDTLSWSNAINDFATTYAMSWNGANVNYQATIGNWSAPKEYVVRWKMNANDAWSWSSTKNANNQCVALVTHQVTETFYNTVVPFWMDPAKYCHFVKQ